MKNVSVRYYSDMKKMFITRHRNDPTKVLERFEATNNVLNEMVRMVTDFGKDGSLVSFKAGGKEYVLVMMSMDNLNEVQAYFDHKNKMIQEQMNKLKVNIDTGEAAEVVVGEPVEENIPAQIE